VPLVDEVGLEQWKRFLQAVVAVPLTDAEFALKVITWAGDG
jgi:hypothetical protein